MLKFVGVFTFLSFFIAGVTFLLLRWRLKLSKIGNRRLLIFLTLAALLMIFAPVAYRWGKVSIENPVQQVAQFAQYFLMGWIAITMITFAVIEMVQLLSFPFNPSKRIFLTEGVARGVLTATTLATVGGLVQAELGPMIKPVKIKLETLPESFDQLRIAQISDVHIGPLLHEPFLNHVVDQVMSFEPDLIFITGDLVDGTVGQLEHMMGPLKRLKAKEGIYFCTGNHEYYSGAEEWIAYLESIGIHVFKNSNLALTRKATGGIDEKILLAGVFDWQGARYLESHRPDAKKASETTEAVACKILLAHNPQSTEENGKHGFNLQISGHTHAGQFYPFVFVAGFVHKYFDGLYRVNDSFQVYVNRGTGYWGPPNRLGRSSEVTHITLSRT